VDTFNKRLACAILALAPFSSTTANATYLYNNIDVSSGGTASASTLDNGPLGNSFSTGSAAYTLTSVDLLVLADNPSDGGSFTVSLLSDSSIHPGATIATDTFNDAVLSTSLSTEHAFRALLEHSARCRHALLDRIVDLDGLPRMVVHWRQRRHWRR
jgi:hypothetical protein